jgi:hypothetical protein
VTPSRSPPAWPPWTPRSALTTFGTSGRLTLPALAGYQLPVSDLADDRRGGLLVASATSAAGTEAIVLRRIDLATGRLDTSFGDGGAAATSGRSHAEVAVDSLGRIYLPTGDDGGTGSVLRLTPQGRPDASYGGQSGQLGHRPIEDTSGLGSLHVDTQDRLVVATRNADSGGDRVLRLLPDSSYDTAFGTHGGIEDLVEPAVALSGDALVVVTSLEQGCGQRVRRYDGSGRPDRSFGGGTGQVDVEADTGGSPCYSDAGDVVVDPSGRLTFGMWVSDGQDSITEFVRVERDGTLDPDAEVAPGLDAARDAEYLRLDTSPDGRLLLTGKERRNGRDVGLVAALVPDVRAAAGGRFVPLTPHRVLDTRIGHGAPQAKVGPRQSVRLQVAGTGQVPARAMAVVLNVTAVDPTAPSHVTVHPTGTAKPTASNLNLHPGVTTPNLVTVKVGTGGAVQLYNDDGAVDLLADVAGYYVADSASAVAFSPLPEPVRLLDTRFGQGAPAARVRVLDLAVRGRGGVPADATAVVLNVTAVHPSSTTHITVSPSGEPLPVVSNLNLRPGDIRPNLVTVKLGSAGAVRMTVDSGDTDLVADVFGWYGPSGATSFVPLAPTRLVDTRYDLSRPLEPQEELPLDVEVSGVPYGAAAVVLNLTSVDPTAAGHLVAGPYRTPPRTSNLNFTPGSIVPNLAVVTPDALGLAGLYNSAGRTHVIADLAGYFVD